MTKNNGSGSGRNAPGLPKQQLIILAICRFAEPVAMTSVRDPAFFRGEKLHLNHLPA